ncbi:DUF2953 domain-containing protein [Orenia marismortui]|uniref:DUF2953 domain-containing protein n=1 Tax=Orenia marismortui TaxID=46469 RepID=UPI000372EAB6|nr:DUF2953 domain-containing protein [Orenia marismortui]
MPIKLKVKLYAEQTKGDLIFKLRITFFKYKLELPFLHIDQKFSISSLFLQAELERKLGKDIKIKEDLEGGEKNYEDLNNIVLFFKEIKQGLSNTEDILSIIDRCEYFSWKTNFGFANPAYTGVITGFLWSIKGVIISIIENNLKFKSRPFFEVNPEFDYPIPFKTKFEGIFVFKLGNIMFIGLKVSFIQLKRRLKING